MRFVLLLAAMAALLMVFSTARAVEEPPDPHFQLVEVEQMTPYLESFNSITAGTATQSAIRRQGNTGGVVFSSQAFALFDNQNGDGSRATFPLEVEDADTYGVSAQFVRGPTYGIVQVSIDGRPLGAPFDAYAPALEQVDPVPLGTRALAEGKHMLTFTVTGKNAAATNYLAGIDLLILDSTAAEQPTPTAVATIEVGGTVPATLALTLGPPATFGAFQPGVAREYTATTTANVVSSAGDAALSVSRPGPPAQRHVHAAAAAAGVDRPRVLERAGLQRAVHAHVPAGDRRERRAADRRLREDADVHAVDDESVRVR